MRILYNLDNNSGRDSCSIWHAESQRDLKLSSLLYKEFRVVLRFSNLHTMYAGMLLQKEFEPKRKKNDFHFVCFTVYKPREDSMGFLHIAQSCMASHASLSFASSEHCRITSN